MPRNDVDLSNSAPAFLTHDLFELDYSNIPDIEFDNINNIFEDVSKQNENVQLNSLPQINLSDTTTTVSLEEDEIENHIPTDIFISNVLDKNNSIQKFLESCNNNAIPNNNDKKSIMIYMEEFVNVIYSE